MMKRIMAFVISALALVLISAMVGAAATPFKVGCIVPLTGGSAANGVYVRRGAEIAIAEINAKGGVAGRPVELIMADDAGVPATSVSAMNKLVFQDKVDFLIGGNISSTVLAHMQVSEKEGIPYIVTTASNAQITRKENKWTVRLHQNDLTQAVHLAEFVVNTIGKKNIAVMFDTGDYGTGCKNAFNDQIAKLGLQPLITIGFNTGDKDFMSQIIQVRAKNPDAVMLFCVQAEAAIITNQLRQMGITATICGTGGFVIPKYIELAPGTSEGAIGMTTFSPFDEDPAFKAFTDAYQKAYGELPTHHGWNTYEAFVYLLKPIVDKVGTDKTAVMAALKSYKWTVAGAQKYFDESGQVIMPSKFISVQGGVWKPFKK
jgi:branched-chain amino acid transport system substrate-binding protein